VGPDIDVMNEKNVDAVEAESQQRLLERTHGAVIGIIDHRGVRQAADIS
jgi:hypothetical protein